MSDEFDGTSDDDVAQEVDDMPDSLKDDGDDDIEIEGEDISHAESGGNQDWIEAAKDVTFEITTAMLNTYTPPGETWKSHSLKLYLRVDRGGVDGKGKYAGKMFFPNSFGNIGGLLITVNRKDYDFTVNSGGKPTKFYAPGEGGAFADYKDFLVALGFPVNPTPNNNKAFRDALVGRKLVADITKKQREVYDKAAKKRVKIDGEFENELVKYRAVKVQAVDGDVEEAAA